MNDRVEQLLANDPLIGRTVLGRFEVLRPLARGGMGVLYLARTLGAKGFVKPVVVKRLGTDTSDEMLRMFVREAQVMAHLSHPNIVQAIDFNREGSQYLLVLEYVEGYTLGRWAKFMRANGREFPVQFAVQIVLDVLEALAYAHGLTAQDGSPATVIHRDVTPSNVMLSTDGHVKLLDFGIARLEHERSAEGPDGPTIKGKFAFLAPEVLAGDPPTANSDVYSAAVMLHELLVGRNEFAAEDLSATLVNVVKHRPSRLDAMRADVTSELAAVIEHALEKVPSLRFATAQEFAAALRAARGADPQHVREALVAQLRQDFFDPKLVESMGGYDLRTLAHAWQSEPTPRPSITAVDPASPNAQEQRATLPEVRPKRAPAAQQDAHAPREQGTVSASGPKITIHTESSHPTNSSTIGAATTGANREDGPESKGGGIALAAWAAVLAAVAALGAAGLVLYRSHTTSAQQGFVVVEANAGSTANDNVHPDAAAIEAIDASATEREASTIEPSRPTVSRDQAARLTAQFARNRAAIEGCVRDHHEASATDIEAIRLVLDASGTVREAGLVPAEAERGAVGACVLGVARRARFAVMAEGVTFRLPLAMHVRGR